MCNCGNKRHKFSQQITTAGEGIAVPVQKSSTTNFQYAGNTAITITGGITRKPYRFNYPGDIQAVDQRDARGLMGIAVLQVIR